ncbi:MAG: hypothetical protein K2X81_08000, partial [Candidatus Obscuribacterales bacterium]|nr:hypothetical protein [Candidatus Obscuribacterales bacterium]
DTEAIQTPGATAGTQPSSKLAMVLSVICVPLCIGLSFFQKPDPLSLSLSRDEAVKTAREYVHKEGLDDPALSLCFQKLKGDINDEACQCLQDKLGRARFEQTFNDTAHPQIWNVRFCGQQMIKEIVVQIDACKRSVIGATLKLPDDAAGAHLTQAEAVGRVEKFLREYHKDMLPFKLVGQKTFERSGRTDFSTEWECSRFGASDSKLRLECATVGDVVSGFKLNWDLPDKWSWKYREFTIRRGAMTFIVVLELLLLIVATLVNLLRVPKNHAPSFRWIGGYVGLMAALIAAMVALQTPNLLSSYDSQTPFVPFVIQTYLYQLINMIPILCVFGVLLIVAADSGQQYTPFDKSRLETDKLVPLITEGESASKSLFTGYSIGAIAVLLTIGAVKLICSYTTEAVYSSYDIASWLAQSQCPSLLAIVFAALCSVASVPILGVADGIIRRYLPSKLKFTFANLLFSVAVAGMTKQSHDIVLLAALIFAAIQVIYILLKRVFTKDPFSLAVAVYFFILTFAASVLYQLARPLLQIDSFICIAALLLPLLSIFTSKSQSSERRSAS